jgi:hypothetical protein
MTRLDRLMQKYLPKKEIWYGTMVALQGPVAVGNFESRVNWERDER